MRIVPAIVVGTKQFQFGDETLLLDGKELHCLVLFDVADREICAYFERKHLKDDGNITEKMAVDLLNFIYEGFVMPESMICQGYLDQLIDAARIYMETCKHD